MKTLAERFAEARSLTGLNPSAFAREIGTTRTAVYFIEDGTTHTLKHETATRAANRSGVNVEWLATGKGPMRPTPARDVALAAREPPERENPVRLGSFFGARPKNYEDAPEEVRTAVDKLLDTSDQNQKHRHALARMIHAYYEAEAQ